MASTSRAAGTLPTRYVGPAGPTLPPLPYAAWDGTRRTLHLLCQMLGKLRLATVPRRNHWWHVPLYLTPRGLTTGAMFAPNDPMLTFDVELDLIEHGLEIRTSRGGRFESSIGHSGTGGMRCDALHAILFDELANLGVDVAILDRPYELAWCDRPFSENDDRRAYEPGWANRWWRTLSWVDRVFNEYRGGFLGKSTPSHFFWHSFDLAVTRFSGRPNPRPVADFPNPRDAEAYSHEVMSIGFWPGDDSYQQAAFYAYAVPGPDGLADEPLEPAAARWAEGGGRLDYDDLRQSDDPRRDLLAFLNSAYAAAAKRGDWPDLALPPESHYRG